jgi:hypothetical protein
LPELTKASLGASYESAIALPASRQMPRDIPSGQTR